MSFSRSALAMGDFSQVDCGDRLIFGYIDAVGDRLKVLDQTDFLNDCSVNYAILRSRSVPQKRSCSAIALYRFTMTLTETAIAWLKRMEHEKLPKK